jgi:ribonuclease PH
VTRADGRRPDELRPVRLELGYLANAEGSCLASAGNTRVLCAASVERRVPPFLAGTGQGWLTAEYGLLPRSTNERISRERAAGPRSQEIQRFIGRSLRAVANLARLGEQQITVDCDVLQADGGTRTLAVTGAFCAVARAAEWLVEQGRIESSPFIEPLAAVSVGIVHGEPLLDLDYGEDSQAGCDMNLVMTASGRIVEVQATAEGMPFTREEFGRLYELAAGGIRQLLLRQQQALSAGPP